MTIEIIGEVRRKPASSTQLANILRTQSEWQGQLYFAFPIIGSLDGRHIIDAILITPDRGIFVFDLVEGTQHLDCFQHRQDDSANKLEARLKLQPDILDRRKLKIPIRTVSFAPGYTNQALLPSDSDYPVANSDNLVSEIESVRWLDNEDTIYLKTLSAIQSINTIRKVTNKRVVQDPSSRGQILTQLEDSIATFDANQSRAVLEFANGIQRIRGLAGSGKTVVLAAKAAYLHTLYPEWQIAITFNTRSLKGHFRNLINQFSYASGVEPDYERINILTAWGAPGGGERNGVYHDFCDQHGIPYYDFRSASMNFGSSQPFASVCREAISQLDEFTPKYDAVLIDEAQDLPVEFIRLCYLFAKTPKRFVYAYDELQNLTDDSLPPPEELLEGLDSNPSNSLSSFDSDDPSHDIILPTCYRNSRPILTTAHALGFGIYRRPFIDQEIGLVQMFEHPTLWHDIGYSTREGTLSDGQPVSLYRSTEHSPEFLENHSNIEDLIQFAPFQTEEEQAQWLVQAILSNLQEDELRPDDIMVINPNPRTTRRRTALPRSLLYDHEINSHLAGVDTHPDIFIPTNADSIVFTGIHRAKGNEAAMVYIINAQDCFYSPYNLATIRNQLFTAITRSKSWVRILGVGTAMHNLMTEFNQLANNNFELRFTYPTAEQRQLLRIVHRDMTRQQKQRIQNKDDELRDLIADLNDGVIHIADLDKNIVDKLRSILS